MLFDMIDMVKHFDDKVDSGVISRIISLLRSYYDNRTKDKLHTLLANIPVGYLLTKDEILEIVNNLSDTKFITSKNLIDMMKDKHGIKELIADKLNGKSVAVERSVSTGCT
jgi:hypothetical protein